MGRETKIAWTDHTFNGVRGCAKVSPGCDNCYAEGMSKRNPTQLGVWGEEGTRVLGGPDYWANLDKWHRAAVRDGVLRRVFCYSLGDVFESPRSLANADVCAKGRALLFDAIERLRPVPLLRWDVGLVFLLLTKRPENVRRMVPATWLEAWPQHVWLGTSVENQQAADERVPHLLDVPGVPVRFLSLEPLLGPIRFPQNWIGRVRCVFDWMIIGGEGLGKRPCDLAWIRDLRDQGREARCTVFVKQLGSSPYDSSTCMHRHDGVRCDYSNLSLRLHLKHPKGEDPEEWPADLRVREVPEVRL